MRLSDSLTNFMFRLLYDRVAMKRPADQYIGDGPYMLRWWLFGTSKKLDDHGNPQPRRPFGRSFYFHCFLRSDDDRALHDHPWDFTSIILFGSYREQRREKVQTLPNNLPWIEPRDADEILVAAGTFTPHSDEPILLKRTYSAGCVLHSNAEDAHRVELLPQVSDLTGRDREEYEAANAMLTQLPWMHSDLRKRAFAMWRKEQPAFTLFYARPWKRHWGFHCDTGWKYWRDFDNDGGCGEPQ